MTTAAFKEWSRICIALGSGDQSLVLRKGGIHEKSGGFQWDHNEFWLFPTRFHEEDNALTEGAPPAPDELPSRHEDGSPESVEIRHLARIESKYRLPDLETVHALADLHFWKPETVEERFEWSDDRCLWLAVLRIYEAEEAVTLPWQKGFGGCRSWLELPETPSENGLRPVLSDDAHTEIEKKLEPLLAESPVA